MNEIQLFNNPEFGQIRVAEINGRTYFVGNDVAKALGYSVPKDAISAHCKGALKHRLPTNGGEQEMNVITEGDIYRLAAKSQLPNSEKFESWIFDEVLPSIRKNGAYLTDSKIEEVLTNPDTIIKLATQLKEERAEKQRLSLIANEQSNQLKLQAPKVEYCDKVLSSSGLLTVTMIADCLGISEIKLNKLLREWNVQYKESGTYHLYTKYKNYGYTETKPYPYTDSIGNIKTRQHMYWTEKGKKFILDCYARYQQLQNIKKGALA